MGPPDAIADIAEEDGAQGAHEEADGEGPEGRHQGERGIVRRKIELADGAGEIAVDGEVVPLHHIAGDAGRDDAAMRPPRVLARHGCVIVLPPVRPRGRIGGNEIRRKSASGRGRRRAIFSDGETVTSRAGYSDGAPRNER